MATRKDRSAGIAPYSMSDAGLVPSGISDPGTPDYVVAELRYEAPLALARAGFGAPAAAPSASGLNEILARFGVKSVRSHFGLSHDEVATRVALASALPPRPSGKALAAKGVDHDFKQRGFVELVPGRGEDAPRLCAAIKKHASIWDAYVAPRPVPASLAGSTVGSRLFEPAQGYLASAPDGIGALDVRSQPGATGSGVTICDIEGAWNLAHQDLPRGIRLIGGTMSAAPGWRDHGTAVLGEMVSVSNAYGTVGISPGARALVQSAFIGGVFNLPAALSNATSVLKAGDVILIELQSTGPAGQYVAMQYWSAIFLAIQIAVAKGITVVEAAGNGDQDFDAAVYAGSGLQKDSGAIVVGAGVPPTNFLDFDGFAPMPPYASLGVPRSRIFFSNYGKIVDVQGWGWNVTTLGYGDAQGGGTDDTWYTLRFSGTSSASPIVTGAVACLQGRSLVKNGGPLTPARVRSILRSTGTPQAAGPGVPLAQRIGPLPDLTQAMKRV